MLYILCHVIQVSKIELTIQNINTLTLLPAQHTHTQILLYIMDGKLATCEFGYASRCIGHDKWLMGSTSFDHLQLTKAGKSSKKSITSNETLLFSRSSLRMTSDLRHSLVFISLPLLASRTRSCSITVRT